MKTLAQFSLEDAQKIAEESDYAFAASETDCNPINWGDAAAFVLEGHKACLAELTRWHDPKEIVPNHKWAVLVKLTPSIYDVASYSTELERWIFVNYSLDREEIIGWREIHE